jgi:hypothetical protein
LDPVPAAVPTQSFLARSKYDAAPGPPGAIASARAAVAAGLATARPARRAAHPVKMMKRRPRAMAKPPSLRLRAEEHIGRLEGDLALG